MNLEAEACYRALVAQDRRFDGLFYVGVSSTGIYCRCVCTARTPKRENCTFYRHPAEAERAGFRPCLLCRPELAPGNAPVDATSRLAAAAYRRIEDGALDEMSLDELAEELGVTDRHLRRALTDEFGISPVELAQTQRLLMAKRLLTDTNLPIGQIALDSGFASVRRFNTLFQERYRLSPGALRKQASKPTTEAIRLEVSYREPYDWERLLAFLERRCIPGVEQVQAGVYQRTVDLAGQRGVLSVHRSRSRPTLTVEMTSELKRKAPLLLRKVRRLFDTDADPYLIAQSLGDLAFGEEGVRVPGAFDGFEAAVRAVLGQQVSVAAARTFAGRLVARFGEPVETGIEGLTHVFPTAQVLRELSPETLSEIGLVKSRAKTLFDLASADLRLVPGVDVDATLRKLRGIAGIGEWTAQYIAMRALSYPDAFPGGDLGVLKALHTKSEDEAKQRSESWRPWRAYAVMHLWNSLESKQ